MNKLAGFVWIKCAGQILGAVVGDRAVRASYNSLRPALCVKLRRNLRFFALLGPTRKPSRTHWTILKANPILSCARMVGRIEHGSILLV